MNNCIWHDCDQAAIYCPGHAAELCDVEHTIRLLTRAAALLAEIHSGYEDDVLTEYRGDYPSVWAVIDELELAAQNLESVQCNKGETI